MNITEAQTQWSDWMNNTILFAEELGPDTVAMNEAVLQAALPQLATAPDLDAFMAETLGQLTLYDDSFDFDGFDNSGAVVIFDNGTQMSYADYQAAGYEGGDDPFGGMAPVFDIIDPLEARKPVIGVDDMCKMTDA